MEIKEVNEAFEILLEEIEAVVNKLNEEGSDAFQIGNYKKVQAVIEVIPRLNEFHEKVKALQKEWEGLFSTKPGRKRRKRTSHRTKLSRGLRTPENAFRRPILETLVELGGSASSSKVIDLLEQKLKNVLNEYDYQPLPSKPQSVRWRNTAKWCRNSLIREGLMKSNSPYGLWEISEQGRKWLEKHKER